MAETSEAMMHPELEKIYSQIPKVNCVGKCGASCGVIPIMPIEAEHLAGRLPSPNQDMQCTHLTIMGTCAIYRDRPAICQLYGAVKPLKCPHGCQPERWLTDQEVDAILSQIYLLKPGKGAIYLADGETIEIDKPQFR